MSAFMHGAVSVFASFGTLAEIAVLVFPLVSIALGSVALMTMLRED